MLAPDCVAQIQPVRFELTPCQRRVAQAQAERQQLTRRGCPGIEYGSDEWETTYGQQLAT